MQIVIAVHNTDRTRNPIVFLTSDKAITQEIIDQLLPDPVDKAWKVFVVPGDKVHLSENSSFIFTTLNKETPSAKPNITPSQGR